MTINTIAATIIWNSTLLPAFHDQIGIPITESRKVKNSTFVENIQHSQMHIVSTKCW